MSYSISYEDMANYLYVHIEGPESYDDANCFWEELRKEADVRKKSRFLIVDDVTGVLDLKDVYLLSARIASLFKGQVIAYVDPKKESYVANQYGESIISGQGVKVRLFKTEIEAFEWLNNI